MPVLSGTEKGYTSQGGKNSFTWNHEFSLPGKMTLSHLWEIRHWRLQPEYHNKEQILEHFLTVVPEELQASVREHHPDSGEEAVTFGESRRERLLDQEQ
ncbi:hypothetical protein HPG69_008859, partial [Diceros bicornis minor]